jgi:hypothetical protein
MKKTDLIALIETPGVDTAIPAPPAKADVLAEINRLLGIADDSDPEVTLTTLKDLVQGKGAGGQTAIRVLRQIAAGSRRTREVRLASACVNFLDTLGTANSGPPRSRSKFLRNALAAADQLVAALDQPEDDSASRAALLLKHYSPRELGCMRIGLRTHRREIAGYIVDMPLHERMRNLDDEVEADLLTTSQLIRELETVLPE